MRRPVEDLEHDWSDECRRRDYPVCDLRAGVLRRHGPALRAPTGHVHWPGAETAEYRFGYMHGAGARGRPAGEVLWA